MLGFNAFAAETAEEARASRHLGPAGVRQPARRPAGEAAAAGPPALPTTLPPQARALLRQVLSCSAIGDAATVQAQDRGVRQRTGADELMVTSQIYDHEARLRSYEIVAEAMA